MLHDLPTPTAILTQAIQHYGDRIAFRSATGALSYRAMGELIGQMQAVLVRHGLKPGQRVVLLSANRPEVWCAGAAVNALGAVTSWLHPLGALSGHVEQCEDATPAMLVIDEMHFSDRGRDLAAAFDGMTIFSLGPSDFGVDLVGLARAAGACSIRDASEPDAIGDLGFTGGTTGRAKGIVRSTAAMSRLASSVLAEFPFPDRPNYLALGPISHVTGTKILPVFMRGGTVDLLTKFDPSEVVLTIERQRINCTLAVPTMIYSLLGCPELDRHDITSLELILYGASPMAPTRLGEALERMGPVFVQLYGQTECYPIAVLGKEDHDLARPELLSACGFPIGSLHVAVVDANMNPVAAGDAGEIVVRGPLVMDGYWQNEAQTAQAFAGGWLHTGDVAHTDEEGRIYIVDRMKEMIISGGFNIYPREIEDVLASHEGVAMAAVIGTPDEFWGETVRAFVIPKPDVELSGQALIDFVKARKGSMLAPKHVEIVKDLPLTGPGKVDKSMLRQAFWSGRDRHVG